MKLSIIIRRNEFARSEKELKNQYRFLNISKGNLSLKIRRMVNKK